MNYHVVVCMVAVVVVAAAALVVVVVVATYLHLKKVTLTSLAHVM